MKRIAALSTILMMFVMLLTACDSVKTEATNKKSSEDIIAMKTDILKEKHIYLTVGTKDCEFSSVKEALAAVDNKRYIVYIMDDVHTESGIKISKEVTIRGFGSEQSTIQAAADLKSAAQRVFLVEEGGNLRLEGLTIQHGSANEIPRSGAGILNLGKLVIESCNIRDNIGTYGVGIESRGYLSMKNSIIEGNKGIRRPVAEDMRGVGCGGSGAGLKVERGEAELTNCLIKDNGSVANGGGIHVSCYGSAVLTNCTIAENNAASAGGGMCIKGDATLIHCSITKNASSQGDGVYVEGKISMVASIIAGNEYSDFELNSNKGSIKRNEYNLIGDGKFPSYISGEPRLKLISYNGVDTMTYGLEQNSPAVDAIPKKISFAETDQRGVSRLNGNSDIGAYELEEKVFISGTITMILTELTLFIIFLYCIKKSKR